MMNEHRLRGKWKEITGKAKATWANLTDQDLEEIDGRTEALAGKIQERYGVTTEEAKRQVKEFQSNLD